MDGQTDGLMDGQDGQGQRLDEWMDRKTDRLIEGSVAVWMNGHIGGGISGWMDGQTDSGLSGCWDGWT